MEILVGAWKKAKKKPLRQNRGAWGGWLKGTFRFPLRGILRRFLLKVFL